MPKNTINNSDCNSMASYDRMINEQHTERMADHSSRGLSHELSSLGRWDRGFESHIRHGCSVCICVYAMFVLSCV
jgi:hypothetical protein